MSLLVKDGGQKREVIPEGSYIGRCVSIIDLGHQYSKQYDKWYPKVLIQWELPDFTYAENGKTKARLVGERYTRSLSEKGRLRKVLEAWRGRAFTEEERQGFCLEKLLGLPCVVNIIHNVSNENTYPNISSIMLPIKGTEIPEQINESTVFDIDKFEALKEVEALPEWIGKIVKESREWAEITAQVGNNENCSSGDCADDDLPF